MDNSKKFVTVINCMDGRVQVPVNEYMIKKFKADYLDTITEPGPNKILSEEINKTLVESIKFRFEVSTVKHSSKNVAIVGHYDCGGNPAEKEEQLIQTAKSVELVKSWNKDINVFGLWVDETWTVHEM